MEAVQLERSVSKELTIKKIICRNVKFANNEIIDFMED
jgi:hypothetical protein